MKHFITFLVENWYLILQVFLTILAFIILLIKKPTNKVVSGLFENLYSWCISAIKVAEETGLSGKDKLSSALANVLQNCSVHYPELDSKKYTAFIIKIIESILETPTKKGGYGREE